MKGTYRALGPDGFGTYEMDGQSMTRVEGHAETTLVPGFVDIHIHGGFGVDFMVATTQDILKWAKFLRSNGYEGFVPTTVTAPAEAVKKAIANLPDDPMILGFHLEGPFISPKFPGAQPQDFIVAPPAGETEWDVILADPRLKVVTVAPEIPGALGLIRRLADLGVIASMGHTNSTYAEAEAGFNAGARHTTHTFNAMKGLHHRQAGTVGFALTCEALATELIYDRHHVTREAASILVKCKPSDKVIGVSDGTQAAGMPDGQSLRMWGLDCEVKDGQVRLLDGTLAGSAITLLDAFRNFWEDFGPEMAIRGCSLNPRTAIGLVGAPRVWVEYDKSLQIVAVHE